MYTFTKKIIEDFRIFRTKKLSTIAKLLLKLKISANVMTTLSLLFGFAAVYFLFTNYVLFILFAILHLLADVFDGVLARLSHSTKFGKYYDYVTDQFITILLLLRIAYSLPDYYAYIAAGLYLLTNIIYSLNKLECPVLFARTFTIIPLLLSLPTIAYLTAGVISMYSLGLQLQYFTATKFKR